MSVAELKEEIHDFIERADERMLRIIYSIMEGDNEVVLTDAQKIDLDRRLKRIEDGDAKFYTLDELENRLSELL